MAFCHTHTLFIFLEVRDGPPFFVFIFFCILSQENVCISSRFFFFQFQYLGPMYGEMFALSTSPFFLQNNIF